MKINSISINPNVKNVSRTNKIPRAVTVPISEKQKDTSEFFRYYMGREMVSFRGRPFNETVNKNWFQLPNGFQPDVFQVDAGKALNENKNVLVEAPTGTGKTAIAQYVTSKNMNEGKTTFYTTPLKALSNQKLNEFRNVWGEENVGILTGDRRENINAPILIMTTEVYRNMALSNMYGADNPLMQNLGSVIFDEFHYLGDDSRGSVWEESIMLTPPDVQVLGLSATIGNPKDLKDWQSGLKGEPIELVSMPASARAVPLTYGNIFTDSYEAEQKAIERKIKKTGTAPEMPADYRSPKPKLSDFKMAVDKLSQKEQLPAILFIFSRKFSRELLEYLGKNGADLTNDDEKKEIESIVNKYRAKGYIGADLDIEALSKGYAIHNAGIIPAQKELIEELFQKKLTKVVIATETLAAGINMPAKTVVISSPFKPTDAENPEEESATRTLTANEFKQMSGRAGRRGIDTQGFVYTMPVDRQTEQEFLYLEVMSSNPLVSNYNPDYAFLSGYYEYNDDDAKLKDFVGKSFYAYSADDKEKLAKTQELIDLSEKRTNVLLRRGFLTEDENGLTPTVKGNMASQIRGYDALTIVEAFASKKFDGITPESLAMIAGAMANPAKQAEGAISMETDLGYVFEPSVDYVDSVYKDTQHSLSVKLKKLGHDISEFDNYQDMLDFVKDMKKPDIPEEEMIEELKIQAARRAKVYTITKQTGKMSPADVVKALRKGEVVPSKVLEDQLKMVEQYKNRISTGTIPDYIDKLEADLKANSSDDKGKKAKARLEKKCDEIRKAIDNARNMQYLDMHVMNAIADNYRFLQKNSLRQVKADYASAEQMWIKLTSKDAIISQIEALKDMEEYLAEHDVKADGYENLDKTEKCLRKLQLEALENFKIEGEEGILHKPERYSKIGAQVLYNWALLNKINSYSMANWEQLLRIVPTETMDEGSIYRSVLQTADLLGQMAEVAQAGVQNSTDEADKEYYSKLGKCAAEARNLLIKYPVEV